MKKIWILACCVLFINVSCAIQGEVYRLQTRMNYWYELLSNEEKRMFAEQNFVKLGEILDQKESTDSNYQNQLRKIRINEAVMSFNGEQTAHFFYNVLLKDLAKFSYKEFLKELSVEEKKQFIQTLNFTNNVFADQSNIFSRAKKEFGFNGFTDREILNYYRNSSFTANFYPIVYDVLAFLARYRNMDVFLQGNVVSAVSIFDDIEKRTNSTRRAVKLQAQKDLATWNGFKQRTYLESLNNNDFLQLIYDSILPNMDQQVKEQTIRNIKQRFEEE